MYARSTTFHARPALVEGAIAYLREEAMPTLLSIEGCVGLSVLADRTRGRCIVISPRRIRNSATASSGSPPARSGSTLY